MNAPPPHPLTKLFHPVEQFIFQSPTWKFVSILLAVAAVKTGVWYIPNLWEMRAIAQNPFVNPFLGEPNLHYIVWSWLGPFLAWLVHARGKGSFFLFHLAFSVGFTLLFVRLVLARLSPRNARVSLVLFSLLPVSATAYFWVGPDSITLFLMLVALSFPRHPLVSLVAGVGLGMQHFEQSVLGTLGLLVATAWSGRRGETLAYPLKSCTFLLAGTIAGRLGLSAIFSHWAIEVNSGRVYFLRHHLGIILGQFFLHFQAIVWSLFGIGWLAVLRYWALGRRAIPFLSGVACLLLLLPISGDQTRVGAVVTFLLVAVYLLLNEDFLGSIQPIEVAVVFVLWLFVPWSWVWGGITMWSVLPYDVAYLLHRFFGLFDVPTNPSLWPFVVPPPH